MAPPSLAVVVGALQELYGPTPKCPPKTAFDFIVWENAAYLVDDERRLAVFRAVGQRVGLRPEAILGADPDELQAALEGGGMHLHGRIDKLRHSASLVLDELDGDLDAAIADGGPRARRVLKKFPGIGDPGADKILLFTRQAAALALDSNGLRVLLRLGFGTEAKSYSTTYRSALRDVGDPGQDLDFLIRAHELLRRHGKETCRNTGPACGSCPLADPCAFAAAQRG